MPQVLKNKLPPLNINDHSIGKVISKIRKKRGLTQLELARKIGITRTALSAYESGRVRLYDEMIARFALALNISTDILLGLKKNDILTHNTDFKITKRVKELEALPLSEQKKILDHIKDLADKNNMENQFL